jgi:hypothetical protein
MYEVLRELALHVNQFPCENISMKTDRYTKIILTIIAAALIFIAGQNIFEVKSATAGNGVVKVAVCNLDGDWCADIVEGYKRSTGSKQKKLVISQDEH